MSETGNENNDCHIIKLRGLPWNAGGRDILTFLKDIEVLKNGVHLITSSRDGRPNGEAFVECASENDYIKAFDFHKNLMGTRYIEIFGAKKDEFDYIMKKQNFVLEDTFLKLRGLPYSVNREDIETFFEGLELKPDKDSVQIMLNNRGRPTGEAYIQFSSEADTEKALKKNREKIGHRYIEIFRSSSAEFRRNRYLSRPVPYKRDNRGSGTGRRFTDTPIWMNLDNREQNQQSMLLNNLELKKILFTVQSLRNSDRFNNMSGNSFENRSNNFGSSFGGNAKFGNNNLGNNDLFRGMDFNNSAKSFNNTGNSFGNGYNRDDSFMNSRRDNFDRFNGDNYEDDQSSYCIRLRGMPYISDDKDIIKFFEPIKVVSCNVIYDNRGRHSGEADAWFVSASDVNQAMKRNRDKMGTRYIELFLKKKNF